MKHDDRPITSNLISGAINGPTVQAGSIDGGVHFHVTGEVSDVTAPEQPTPDWANLPDPRVEVLSLLRAQIQAARQLPYRLPGARRPSLATVYVRQDLGSGTVAAESEPQRPRPIVDGQGQLVDPKTGPVVRVAVRAPSRTVRAVLDDQDHLLVTGGPGQGKSTLSLRLAADVAQHWVARDADDVPLAEPVVPLRLTARELVRSLDMPFPDALAATVRTEYGALLRTCPDARTLGERVAGCKWLLMVDGLDEIAESAERDRLVAILAAWASEADSPYRVVLTTRPVDGAALAPLQRLGAPRYELQPFDDEALRQFADSWFNDGDEASRFVRQIRAAHLDELMRVPLLATIAAIVFSEFGDRPLPDNQYELYESYLKYLRSARSVPPSPFEAIRDALLEHLGRVRLEFDTSLMSAAREWVATEIPDLRGDWPEQLVTYLATVGPLTRRGDDLGFLHHSFAEHLAATAYARLLPDRFDPDDRSFARLLHAARPEKRGKHARAVLVHYTRQHIAEADSLLRTLHAGDGVQHLLAARLLASHVPAGPAVVDAFLTTVRAWAMTTQYPGQLILEQASRAAHHPGIADWLSDLMDDEEAPWQSRIEAAAALSARLRGRRSATAAALLRGAADDATIAVEVRLAAAEALSDCGGGERDTAEHSLRAVLADSTATALTCRNAAVTLAALGGAAREHATSALLAMLDDSWTPDRDLVEAATGLIEIGFEFYDRAADVFRRILRSGTKFEVGLGDAALGLAALGPTRLEEAAEAVTALVHNRRLDFSDRIAAIDVLAELGPQHRIAAIDLLATLSTEFGVGASQLHLVAMCFTRRGLTQDALRRLRVVLSDPTVSLNSQRWAAKALADLGPDHRDEAAAILLRVADHLLTASFDRAGALADLAELGEPHRSTGTERLCDLLADPARDPDLRCKAGNHLTQLGPEFHSLVARHLTGIVSRRGDPDVRLTAWRTLRDLGGRFFDSELPSELIDPAGRLAWEYLLIRWYDSRWHDIEDHATTAGDQLIGILRDPSWPGDARSEAVAALISFGRRYHRVALDGTIEMLRSGVVPADGLPWLTRRLTHLGAGPRARLAEIVRDMGQAPDSSAATVCRAAEAVEWLGQDIGPDIIAALRDIVSNVASEPRVQQMAAVALARAVPEEIDHAVDVVVGAPSPAYWWEEHLEALVELRADITPGLLAVLADDTVDHRARATAAGVCARLDPGPRTEALAELRAQAADECLRFQDRAAVIWRLATLDGETVTDAVAYHRAVLDDEQQSIRVRCHSAHQLSKLGNSFGAVAVAALRRFATDPELTPREHEEAVNKLGSTFAWRTPEVGQLAQLVVRDPAATTAYADVRWVTPGATALEIDRLLLTDRTLAPRTRLNALRDWEHAAMVSRAEAMLRDVLTAPETSPAHRVEAAASLAELSPRRRLEAIEVLTELGADRIARKHATSALAELDDVARQRIFENAVVIATDQTCHWRERCHAAGSAWGLTPRPPDPLVEYTRRLMNEPYVSDLIRVRMRYLLGSVDGLDPLRSIRDDRRTRPEIRWIAAMRLREHTIDDRAIGVRTLHAIAADRTCRPALRCRVARDLVRLGERGRRLGIAVLLAMMDDVGEPLRIRVDAARTLAEQRPDLRTPILVFLGAHANTPRPRTRLHVAHVIAQFESEQGTLRLEHLAHDRALQAGVRLRAAHAMATLRRDRREPAAVVAREIMRDDAVPRHIRIKAAGQLARWSDLCRSEAQAVLVDLNALWDGHVPSSGATRST